MYYNKLIYQRFPLSVTFCCEIQIKYDCNVQNHYTRPHGKAQFIHFIRHNFHYDTSIIVARYAVIDSFVSSISFQALMSKFVLKLIHVKLDVYT